MADSPLLPGSHAWTDASGRPLPVEFYKFLRDLVAFIQATSSNTESISELAEQLAELLSRTYNLTGVDSVQVLGLLKDGATVRLVGDENNPLPAHFYATDDDRAKGWNPLYPHWVPNPYADYLVDENGDYLIDENGNFLTGQDGFPIPLEYGGTGGDYSNVAANLAFASPDGSAGAPVFRALVADDIPDHNDVNGLQGGTTAEYYHLTAAEHAVAVTLASGTYTPTLTNVTNISASTAQVCQYLRVGNTVTVSGRIDVTATAAAGTASQVDISLPIASNFAAAGQLGGTAVVFYSPSVPAGILPDTANDRAILLFSAQNTLSMAVTFSFTYLVV